MSDDKSKTGAQDRSRVAAGQDYEARYFAERHGIVPRGPGGLVEIGRHVAGVHVAHRGLYHVLMLYRTAHCFEPFVRL